MNHRENSSVLRGGAQRGVAGRVVGRIESHGEQQLPRR
jgi:hypothetical protein